MKPVLFIHIGRHKTGTTALQNLFYYNRERFEAEFGLYYPRSGLNKIAHHEIGELFDPGRLCSESQFADAMKRDVTQRLLQEISECGYPKVLLSSESFQNVNPQHIRQLFAGYEVKVIVYLRNQADYLVSAFAQQVHGTTLTTSFNKYCLGFMRTAQFARFIGRWSAAFPNNVSVGLYDGYETAGMDFLLNFLQCQLGLDKLKSLETFDTTSGNRNISLSAALTIYKWRLNHVLKADFPEQTQLYFLLMQLSREAPWSERLVLDKKRALPLWLYCHRGNRWVADHCLKQQAIFPFKGLKSAPMSMPDLSRPEHSAISLRLSAEIPSMAGYALDKVFHIGKPW